MKVAFIGNCQLQQIGWLFGKFFEHFKLDFSVVWYEPIFALGNLKAPIVPLFHALESADVIYGQFHDDHWAAFSTRNMSKYFDIKLVPALDSAVSYPQLNYFTEGEMNYNLYTIDFRMLDLYLDGVDVRDVPAAYFDVVPNQPIIANMTTDIARKYRRLFEEGKLIVDYSSEYLRAMARGLGTYYTHNHPNNTQMQWLANMILRDLKSPTLIDLSSMPEILFDTLVPDMADKGNQRYRIRSTELGLKTAAKVYYTFFASYQRDFLSRELEASVYRTVTC